MLTKKQAINKKIITIDCDGVLMKKLLGVTWRKNAADRPKGKMSKSMEWLENKWMIFVQRYFRDIMPGAKEVLCELRNQGLELALVTSRADNVIEATTLWLQKKDIFRYFDRMVFNNERLVPKDYKKKMVGKYEAAAHIDDDPETVKLLSKSYPKKKIIYFNFYKNPPIEAKNVTEVTTWQEVAKIL